MQGLCRDEAPVQPFAFLLKHPHRHFHASLAQHADAAPRHLGKGVDAAYHHPRNARALYEQGAGRRAAVVGTRLKAYVERAVVQQGAVGLAHRVYSVHLSVRHAAAGVKALAYDAFAMHNDGSHHGVGCGMQTAFQRQFDAAAHVDGMLVLTHVYYEIIKMNKDKIATP